MRTPVNKPTTEETGERAYTNSILLQNANKYITNPIVAVKFAKVVQVDQINKFGFDSLKLRSGMSIK